MQSGIRMSEIEESVNNLSEAGSDSMGESDGLQWSLYSFVISGLLVFVAVLTIFIILRHRRPLGIIIKTFRRDCR